MQHIVIKGAFENNLKGIDVSIPHGKLTVITGISGSGKSSLVSDILLREGQKMYFETFSAYTRSRLGKIRPARVSSIEGLLPVVSVGQTHIQANRRSTAGTFSEISPLLRQLFSRFNDNNLKLKRINFSFNSEQGWCTHCKGLGIEEFIDPNKIVINPQQSLRNGALSITLPNGYTIYSQVTIDELNKVCNHEGFTVDDIWDSLKPEQKNTVLYGSTAVKVLYGKHSLESRMKWTGMTARPRDEAYYRGIIPVMDEILKRDRNDNILKFVSSQQCSHCNGYRLNTHALSVTFKGKNIAEYESVPFSSLYENLSKQTYKTQAEKLLIGELCSQLQRLCDLSVGHISCNRLSDTLSQGELRRMRLSQLNHSGLTGVLYLFDEPSAGLHPRDVHMLIANMYQLTEHGNTVIVVEHNDQIIRAADYIVELGPGAGIEGGQLVFSGSPKELKTNMNIQSATANLLRGLFENHQVKVHNLEHGSFQIHISKENNIENQTFTFKKRMLNVITGVSGAGKSTLLQHGLQQAKGFSNIILADQKPPGRTSRSNPATYTGLFDELRKLFASTQQAKSMSLKAGDFSFNKKSGQCSACSGTGELRTGMLIFEDFIQVCPVCEGKRYKSHILEVTYREASIHDVLEMSVNKACAFFSQLPAVMKYLHAMEKLGLGYLKLGQSSSVLSGGEAQRLKLAEALSKPPGSNCLYILDEPTTGLHAADVQKLIEALHEFTTTGHTVVVVEHDKQLIQQAGHIVDIGPEGGEDGGKCLFCGSYENFLTIEHSPTARMLNNFNPHKPLRNKIIQPSIHLEDIHTNNLKHLNIKIPAGQMLALTGASGSGKSSLLTGTLHAEGQRLFTENLSGFRRLQIKLHTGAAIGKVHSMMPSAALDAQLTSFGSDWNLASVSGIYDLLRLLFARFSDNKGNKVLTAADFSYANEYSVCRTCEGNGFIRKCKIENIIVNPQLSLFNGALIKHKTIEYFLSSDNKFVSILEAMAKNHKIDTTLPWNALSDDAKNAILFGTGTKLHESVWHFQRKNNKGEYTFKEKWEGLCELTEQEYTIHYPSVRGKRALELLSETPCQQCHGYRLNNDILQYTFAGKNFGEMLDLTISQFAQIIKTDSFQKLSHSLVVRLEEIIAFLSEAGLGYLPMSRSADLLSRTEYKWLRLSSILSSGLSGMCIILDEPTAGMDKQSAQHLLNSLKKAQKRGNTILVSDHRKEIIESADRIIELGPGSGSKGGQIIADMSPEEANLNLSPITYKILHPEQRVFSKAAIDISKHELLYFDESIKIIKNCLNVISGPAGSGKTVTLKKIAKLFTHSDEYVLIFNDEKILHGHRGSIIATRTGVINDIKKIMSQVSGRDASEFGLTNKASVCSTCKGGGYTITSLDFLQDVKEVCHECNGNRLKEELLEYVFEGKNFAQLIRSTVSDMLNENFISPAVKKTLLQIHKTGLGYLSCNQESTSLSSGEMGRFILAEKLSSISKQAIILFDDPFSGLDPDSVENLTGLFHTLVYEGHTVILTVEDECKNVGHNTIELSLTHGYNNTKRQRL